MIWLVGGRLGNALLSFVSTAVLARLLTPKDFGVVAASLIVLALADTLFDGTFGINLMRKRQPRVEDVRTTLTVATLIALLFMLVIVSAAPAVGIFFHFPHLPLVLTLTSLAIPSKAIYAIASAQLQRAQQFRSIATGTLAGQFAGNIVVAIPLALLGAGIWSLVAAIVVGAACETAFVSIQARLPWRPMLDRNVIHELASKSLFSVADLMNWVANTSANVLVGRLLGATGLGLYSRGWKLLDLFVSAVAVPLSRVLIPIFSRIRDDQPRLERAFLNVLGVVLPAYAVTSAILVLQAPLIVHLALGRQWVDTVPVAQILFATILPRCTARVSENLSVALGRSMSAAVRQSLYASFVVSGTLVGYRFGINGVAIGVSIAITLFYVVSIRYSMRAGGISSLCVIRRHACAAVLAFIAASLDVAMLHVLGDVSMQIRHVTAGIVAASATMLIVFAFPSIWLGKENADSLRELGYKIRSLKIFSSYPRAI